MLQGCVETQLDTFHLVDLAGCKQLTQSKATGSRMKEAIGVNVSLMALKRVIKALVEDHNHVPCDDSKLTMLLTSALGGASRTTAVFTGAMDDHFTAQTLQALWFGESVAQVVNSAPFGSLSVQPALDRLHKSLSTCKHTRASLETRGKTRIDAYSVHKGQPNVKHTGAQDCGARTRAAQLAELAARWARLPHVPLSSTPLQLAATGPCTSAAFIICHHKNCHAVCAAPYSARSRRPSYTFN